MRNDEWAPIACLPNQAEQVELGTLHVTLQRSTNDITTSFEYPDDEFWNGGDGWENQWRTLLTESASEIALRPLCPPRNIVAKPILDLYVPSNSSVTLYIGYPAWVEIVAAGEIVLADLATQLMAQTWLGPNNFTGELAFASPTQARLRRDNLPQTSHTIRSPVTIENDSEQQLHISRLSIPAPELPTYKQGGRLWTAPITITCETDLAKARVEIGHDAPDFLGAADLVSKARINRRTNSISRAIGFLFD